MCFIALLSLSAVRCSVLNDLLGLGNEEEEPDISWILGLGLLNIQPNTSTCDTFGLTEDTGPVVDIMNESFATTAAWNASTTWTEFPGTCGGSGLTAPVGEVTSISADAGLNTADCVRWAEYNSDILSGHSSFTIEVRLRQNFGSDPSASERGGMIGFQNDTYWAFAFFSPYESYVCETTNTTPWYPFSDGCVSIGRYLLQANTWYRFRIALTTNGDVWVRSMDRGFDGDDLYGPRCDSWQAANVSPGNPRPYIGMYDIENPPDTLGTPIMDIDYIRIVEGVHFTDTW